MKAGKRIVIRPIFSRCPWRERQFHATSKPLILTEADLQDITLQISENEYRALPARGSKTFFRCPNCYAVWLAGSIFERVDEERVHGVYDNILIWIPYPWMEREQ